MLAASLDLASSPTEVVAVGNAGDADPDPVGQGDGLVNSSKQQRSSQRRATKRKKRSH